MPLQWKIITFEAGLLEQALDFRTPGCRDSRLGDGDQAAAFVGRVFHFSHGHHGCRGLGDDLAGDKIQPGNIGDGMIMVMSLVPT